MWNRLDILCLNILHYENMKNLWMNVINVWFEQISISMFDGIAVFAKTYLQLIQSRALVEIDSFVVFIVFPENERVRTREPITNDELS